MTSTDQTATITCLTAIGLVRITASSEGVTRMTVTDTVTIAPSIEADHTPSARIARDAAAQLDEYLAGERTSFTVPVDWDDVSEFDKSVLSTLAATVSYGETITYGELAERIGRPRSDSRKIGGALARNRFLVIVPCHRVVAVDGSLTGYAGGIAAKRALLDIESADTRPRLDLVQA